MTNGNGWIKLHREIQHHWIFQRDDYFKAWILLLMKANHQDFKTLVSDKIPEIVIVKRGQVVTSLKKLGIELRWSPSKVKRYLKKLEKDEMIYLADEKRWTHLTILNYETYQYARHEVESEQERSRISVEHNIIKKKKENKEKNLSQKEQLQGIRENTGLLKKKFPNVNVKLEFDRMSDWLLSSGKKYKNYGAFFNNWLRKANENSSGNDTENQITYDYKCSVCNKVKDTSPYKDMFIMCCDEQTIPIT
jgi:hypothetical protein